MMHPITGKRITLLVYIAAWVFMFGTHAVLIYRIKEFSFDVVLIDSLVYNGLFLLFGLGIWYPVRFLNTLESTRFSFVLNHLAIAVVCLLSWTFLSEYILSSFWQNKESYLIFQDEARYYRLVAGVFYYFIILLIYYLITYYSDLEKKSKQEAELQTLIKESELTLLKFQLNPHFLFNSLNSISSLTITNPEKARDMVVKLSEFLRYAIDKNQREMTLLEDELNNIELYLDIEKIRFGDRLIFEKQMDKKCNRILVPNMILQPLFENAVKHGVYESSDPVFIRFECYMKKDFCTLTVINNFDTEIPARKGRGVGLKNVSKRLQLNYNRNDLLYTNKTENKFIAQISIPVESK